MTLSRVAFETMANFCHQGLERISGSNLILDYHHCVEDLLSGQLLVPTGLLSTIELEGEHGSVWLPIRQSPLGYEGYLSPEGWIQVSDKQRRVYRIHMERWHYLIKEALQLGGQLEILDDGLVYLGLFEAGKRRVEIYWSSFLHKKHARHVCRLLKKRLLPDSAIVLHNGDRYSDYELGDDVFPVCLDDLWNPDDELDLWRLQQIIARQVYQLKGKDHGFLWLEESGEFIFPDQSAVIFRGSGKTIVDSLVHHHRAGRSWISQEYLMHEIVGVRSSRIQDIVKRVKDWKRVILVKDGHCRLNIPMRDEEKSVRKRT